MKGEKPPGDSRILIFCILILCYPCQGAHGLTQALRIAPTSSWVSLWPTLLPDTPFPQWNNFSQPVLNFQLRYTTGCSSYPTTLDKIAPRPNFKRSVCTKNSFWKSEVTSTGPWHKACLKWQNGASASGLQWTTVEFLSFVRFVKGTARLELGDKPPIITHNAKERTHLLFCEWGGHFWMASALFSWSLIMHQSAT